MDIGYHPNLGCCISTSEVAFDKPLMFLTAAWLCGRLFGESEAFCASSSPGQRCLAWWGAMNIIDSPNLRPHFHDLYMLNNLDYDAFLCILIGSTEAAFWGMGSPVSRVKEKDWETPLSFSLFRSHEKWLWGHVHMRSAKFLDFLTPPMSAFSCNLPY